MSQSVTHSKKYLSTLSEAIIKSIDSVDSIQRNMATFYSSLVVVIVVLAGLATSVQEDGSYDVSVRVVKPKKLNNLISSLSRVTPRSDF